MGEMDDDSASKLLVDEEGIMLGSGWYSWG